MAISDWPEAERPRERLYQQGPAALSDAELLAIFLRTGLRGCSAVELARRLLSEYGGLRPLLEADRQRFCRSPGLSLARYAQLQATLEMSRRHLQEGLKRGDILGSPEDTRRYLSLQLRSRPHEVFAAIFLDNRHRIIAFRELSQGTINGASVHPREIVREALHINAAAVIFAHNHPSGIAEPSQADISITRRLKETLELIDIRTLDHLIIGDGEVTSLAERGLL